VEEPAKRYGVQVETELVDALMEDAPKEDALPLLAFALQRLWHQYADSGCLTKQNYEKVGGLNGLIEDAAERALRGLEPEQDVPLPSTPSHSRLVELAASTFVPALAQSNEQGATVRRLAEWAVFNEEQQDLLLRFERWRLVARKGEENGGTVEVAHEALFREWARLRDWLETERTRLAALRSLQIDATTWNRNARDPAFLNHRGKRLVEARALANMRAYQNLLTEVELGYLAGCEVAESLARRRSILIKTIVGVLGFCVVAGFTAWFNQNYLLEQWRSFFTIRPYLMTEVSPFVLTSEAERAKQPLDGFRECRKECPLMIVLPAGEFTMGSPMGEKGRNDDEGPQHKVVIAKRFAVSKYEVTFDDWDTCVAYGGCPSAKDMGWGRGQRPVIQISWHDAQRYVAWLSRITNKPYRLLSEAEWEYAERAGTQTAYSWGDEIGQEKANCSDCGSPWHNQTAPVDSFSPNAFGLHNMHGNVWEWVEDCYHADYGGAPPDGSAQTSGACSGRVARGGGWWSDPVDLRSAARMKLNPDDQGENLGLRVARTLEP
jgi:formylglycine-generating enzyme required for sulfatase activity